MQRAHLLEDLVARGTQRVHYGVGIWLSLAILGAFAAGLFRAVVALVLLRGPRTAVEDILCDFKVSDYVRLDAHLNFARHPSLSLPVLPLWNQILAICTNLGHTSCLCLHFCAFLGHIDLNSFVNLFALE